MNHKATEQFSRKKDVVYRMLTFEQTLDNLLNRKTNLAEATLFPSEQAELKVADFQNLFSEMHRVY